MSMNAKTECMNIDYIKAGLFSVQDACNILREELLKHGDLYRAFAASIHSALDDMPEEIWIDEMPEIILKRIIGED